MTRTLVSRTRRSLARNLSIARLCLLHGVSRLEAFGSILRPDFDTERSDIDFLVEFDSSVTQRDPGVIVITHARRMPAATSSFASSLPPRRVVLANVIFSAQCRQW